MVCRIVSSVLQCDWVFYKCGNAAHTGCAGKLKGQCVEDGCRKELVVEEMMTPEKANQRGFMDDFQQRMEEYGSSAMELHAIMANMESTVKEVVQAIPVAIEAEYKGVTDLAGDVKEARKRELGLVYMVDDDLHDLKEVAAKAERVKANAAIIECVFTAMEMTDKSNRLTIKGTEEFHKAIAAGSGIMKALDGR